jgi:Fur family ferric uptake transcriptional regulator
MRRRTAGLDETVSHLCYDPGMVDPSPIVNALDLAGYRLTEPRRSLAALIADQDGHFTAAELVAEARARRLGIGRATVFRTLEVLVEIGAVERLDLPTGEHAYVGCEPTHHHHVVCSRCGRTSEIDDAELRTVVQDVARQTGYRVDEHRLELFGLCPACQRAERGAAHLPA